MPRIVIADTPELFEEGRKLLLEYQDFLGFDLCFQAFAAELDGLATMYGPPRGALLLCEDEGLFVGCVGLRDLGEGVGEMKRMFVRDAHRGRRLGALLLDAFLDAARDRGYRAIRLDTIPRLDRAIAMYRRAGFVQIPAYRFNPDPEAIFMQLELPAR